MNIIYLITNIDKTSGKRFYVGSKQECQICDVGGLPTMIGRDGKPYYSSSASFELREDVAKGNRLSASILENVPDKKLILQKENEWINKLNAVKSDEYYNIGNAYLNCHDQNVIANLYGETVKDLARNNSSTGKRDNSAKDLGFSNFGELCFDIWEKYCELKTWPAVSRLYNKERHWAGVVVKGFDMDKAKNDVLVGDADKVRELISNKCSLQKVGEILGIEYPAVRVLLGDFNKSKEKSFSVALLKGMSKGELEAEITKLVLDGKGLEEVSKLVGVNKTSTNRYFMRCVRRHLKSEDITSVTLETQDELDEARAYRKIKQKTVRSFYKTPTIHSEGATLSS